MKKAIRALIAPVAMFAAAISSAPADAQKRGTDDYRFEQKEWEILEFTTKLVVHPDLASLNDAAERLGVHPDLGNQFASFMVMNKTRKICTIHVLDPRVRYLPERGGHELMHCAYGNFHPSK